MSKDHQQKEIEKAYGEGVKKAENQGFWGEVFHGLVDAASVLVPKTEKEEAKEAGYHDKMKGKR